MEEGVDVTSPKLVLECTVVTPEATILQTPAQFIVLPMFDGELGVAPLHSSFIGRLGFGELRIVEGSAVHRFFIDGGFVQVDKKDVSIITNRAVPADKIDPDVAQEQLNSAQHRKAHSDESIDQRQRLEDQARAQLRVARKGGRQPVRTGAGGAGIGGSVEGHVAPAHIP